MQNLIKSFIKLMEGKSKEFKILFDDKATEKRDKGIILWGKIMFQLILGDFRF